MNLTSLSSPMPAYDLRALDVDPKGLARAAALLGTVLNPALDCRYLTWLYAENPGGAAVSPTRISEPTGDIPRCTRNFQKVIDQEAGRTPSLVPSAQIV